MPPRIIWCKKSNHADFFAVWTRLTQAQTAWTDRNVCSPEVAVIYFGRGACPRGAPSIIYRIKQQFVIKLVKHYLLSEFININIDSINKFKKITQISDKVHRMFTPSSMKIITPAEYAQNYSACKEELSDVKRQLEESNKALQATKQELEQLQICQLCNTHKKSTAVTCQHVFCSRCAKKWQNKKCPICKISIRGFTKLHLGWTLRVDNAIIIKTSDTDSSDDDANEHGYWGWRNQEKRGYKRKYYSTK